MYPIHRKKVENHYLCNNDALKKSTFPKLLPLFIGTLDSPECWLSKTHHCHQSLHPFPLSCNINRGIINEWGKGNNVEEKEEIHDHPFLSHEGMYLHIFSSNWHQFLHHRVICCDLKKDMDLYIHGWQTPFSFNHLCYYGHVMGLCGADASPSFHSPVPPLARLELPLQASWAAHSSPNLLCALSPPCLTLPGDVLAMSLWHYLFSKPLPSSFSVECHFNEAFFHGVLGREACAHSPGRTLWTPPWLPTSPLPRI